MSGVLTGVSTAITGLAVGGAVGGLLSGGLGPVSFNPVTQSFGLSGRMLGGIIPDCAIQESHSDRVIVTRHPVEKGANISDHAYVDPPTVNIRWGWTETLRGEAWASIMYNMLLTMMAARTPLDLFTGKRSYRDMIIESITETTDAWTEYVLIVEITLVNVIIVSTKAATLSEAQADRAKTASPQDAGHVGATEVSSTGGVAGANGTPAPTQEFLSGQVS